MGKPAAAVRSMPAGTGKYIRRLGHRLPGQGAVFQHRHHPHRPASHGRPWRRLRPPCRQAPARREGQGRFT